jgi:ribosomal protein S18 acetylase RimI-like enzyme
MRDHVEGWLTDRGMGEQASPHWSGRAHEAIDRLLDQGRFVGLYLDDKPMIVAALAGPDMDFWTEHDDLHSAWYIARMMTASHGQGLGRQLVQLIGVAAAANGRRFLRLDCMRDNFALHDYYRHLGFTLVRMVEHPTRRSGALFQQPVGNLLPAPWDDESGPAPADLPD